MTLDTWLMIMLENLTTGLVLMRMTLTVRIMVKLSGCLFAPSCCLSHTILDAHSSSGKCGPRFENGSRQSFGALPLTPESPSTSAWTRINYYILDCYHILFYTSCSSCSCLHYWWPSNPPPIILSYLHSSHRGSCLKHTLVSRPYQVSRAHSTITCPLFSV